MAKIVSRKCPVCAGELPPVGDADQVLCRYCGHAFDVQHTAEIREAPATPPPPRAPTAAPSSGSFGLLVGVAVIVVMAVAAWFVVAQDDPSEPAASGGAAGVSWMRTVGLVQANADSIEDVVVLARTASGQDGIVVVVFDGASMRELWRAGPFGSYGQGFQYTHAGALERRLVVTDFRGQAHLFDLASGSPVGVVPLPDRAKQLCRGREATEVFLEGQGGRSFHLDTVTAAVSRPMELRLRGACAPPPDLTIPQAEPERLDGAIAGLEAERSGQSVRVLVDGDVRVAIGLRSAGIRVPMAVGLGPDGVTPAWSVVIAATDETHVAEMGSDVRRFGLGGGRLYAAYALNGNKGARLAALDATTGARLWDTAFPGRPQRVNLGALRIGPNRVLVEYWAEAAVFDARTGRLLGRIATR